MCLSVCLCLLVSVCVTYRHTCRHTHTHVNIKCPPPYFFETEPLTQPRTHQFHKFAYSVSWESSCLCPPRQGSQAHAAAAALLHRCWGDAQVLLPALTDRATSQVLSYVLSVVSNKSSPQTEHSAPGEGQRR